ncbi:ABC transporter ATP-binding protein, partial [Streptomyces olivaceoviridis]
MSGRVVTETMVRVEGVHKSYGVGAAAVHALRGVSFEVPRGELVALKGRSGSGKTTLLNIVGGLDTPDQGRVEVEGRDLARLGESELLRLRRDRVGFVFQSFGLIPILSAAENVGVPLRLRRADPREREERVELLLSLVGLSGHAAMTPSTSTHTPVRAPHSAPTTRTQPREPTPAQHTRARTRPPVRSSARPHGPTPG